MPYKIFGGLRFYDRREIKDMIAYLNLSQILKDIYKSAKDSKMYRKEK